MFWHRKFLYALGDTAHSDYYAESFCRKQLEGKWVLWHPSTVYGLILPSIASSTYPDRRYIERFFLPNRRYSMAGYWGPMAFEMKAGLSLSSGLSSPWPRAVELDDDGGGHDRCEMRDLRPALSLQQGGTGGPDGGKTLTGAPSPA